MYWIRKEIKIALFAAVTAFSFLATGNLAAQEEVIGTFTPPLIADRHSNPNSSWRTRDVPSTARPGQPDQGYYYWNEKYFAGRPNTYYRPTYPYYYDPKYYYEDSNNGSIRYYPYKK